MQNKVIAHIQEFTKRWPKHGAGYSDAALAADDADGGFERLLRMSLETLLTLGSISQPRDLGFGTGRSGMVVPRHECDLLIRLDRTLFVVEAKAWQREVSKDEVFVFLGKVLDFLGSQSFDTPEPVRCGMVALSGFQEAARRIMFAFGFVPFSQRGSDLSFGYLDLMLRRAHADCLTSGWSDLALELEHHFGNLTPFVRYEARPITDVVRYEDDVAVTDLATLRRGTDLFSEGMAAHHVALQTYRAFQARKSQPHG